MPVGREVTTLRDDLGKQTRYATPLMMTRREALALLGSVSTAPLIAPSSDALDSVIRSIAAGQGAQDSTPSLAPGAPTSPERQALIDAFRERSQGIERLFEARSHKSNWVMPYRLFRPNAPGKLPLVVYLHGSGGLGTDNEKQMGLGNGARH